MSQLRALLSAKDLADLWCAERAGLLPDPWLQTSEICAAIYNAARATNTKAIESEAFLYRARHHEPQSAESLEAGRKARQAQAEQTNARYRRT